VINSKDNKVYVLLVSYTVHSRMTVEDTVIQSDHVNDCDTDSDAILVNRITSSDYTKITRNLLDSRTR